jgi:xylulokinase
MEYVIAYDLGTGGLKSSIFNERGISVASGFKQCETFYSEPDFREQRPGDWWDIFTAGTRDLLHKAEIPVKDITAAACSGHSLGVVPVAGNGRLLAEYVPIWSDARAFKQVQEVFTRIEEEAWYLKTGGGFPASLYAAFKILWYKQNRPDLYEETAYFIGTKDFLNYRLTGVIGTDYSYASGSGVYDLIKCDYDREYIEAFGLDPAKFPPLYESHEILGTIKPEIAAELGLSPELKIAAGGVDNACMAAGAGCVEDGMAYTSLGTSSWIAVSTHKPVLNYKTKPYVFSLLIKGMYTSAESIFSAGNTFRWVRDTLCPDLTGKETAGGEDAYKIMDRLAQESVPGANGLFFVPTLAGGTALDRSANVKGALVGLDLKHTRSDIIRAALEGVCFGLRIALDELKRNARFSGEMLIVGGGSKSPFWRRLFAEIYGLDITESAVGENAGSLGAMACAAIGAGFWKDYTPLIQLNKPINTVRGDSQNRALYETVYSIFRRVNENQSDIAEYRERAG